MARRQASSVLLPFLTGMITETSALFWVVTSIFSSLIPGLDIARNFSGYFTGTGQSGRFEPHQINHPWQTPIALFSDDEVFEGIARPLNLGPHPDLIGR